MHFSLFSKMPKHHKIKLPKGHPKLPKASKKMHFGMSPHHGMKHPGMSPHPGMKHFGMSPHHGMKHPGMRPPHGGLHHKFMAKC